jgi:hypothetical protein
VRPDQLGGLGVGQAGDVVPGVGQAPQAPGHRVGPRRPRVAGDVEPGAVEVGQDRLEEVPDGVLAQVRRDVADAQGTVGRAVVGVRTGGRRQGRRVTLRPAAMLLEKLLRGRPRQVRQRQQQAAVKPGVVRQLGDDFAVQVDGLLGPPLLLKGQGEVVAGLGVGGAEAEGLAVMVLRLVEPPLLLAGVAQVVVGLGVVGPQTQGLPEVVRRLARPAQLGQRHRGVVPGVGKVGLELDGLAVAGQRLVVLAHLEQGVAEVVAGLGEMRAVAQGLLQVRHRLLGPPQLAQGVAHRVVCLGGVGLQAQELLEAGQRLLHPVQGLVGRAEVGVVDVGPGVGGERLADQGDGLLELAPLVGEDAEQVEAVGVVGGDLEDLPVELLGLAQVAGLVVLQGLSEHVRDGSHGIAFLRPPLPGRVLAEALTDRLG